MGDDTPGSSSAVSRSLFLMSKGGAGWSKDFARHELAGSAEAEISEEVVAGLSTIVFGDRVSRRARLDGHDLVPVFLDFLGTTCE